jgi:hypothetical protein
MRHVPVGGRSYGAVVSEKFDRLCEQIAGRPGAVERIEADVASVNEELTSRAHGIETGVLEVLLSRAGRPEVDADDVSADALTWVQLRQAVLTGEPPSGVSYFDWLADQFELRITEYDFELRRRATGSRERS